MKKPQFKGDANKYLRELSRWADKQRGQMDTITFDVVFTIFGMVGKMPEVASIADNPVSAKPAVNMGVYRHILERKVKVKDFQITTLEQRVKELETMFSEELRAKEEREWEKYGEDL